MSYDNQQFIYDNMDDTSSDIPEDEKYTEVERLEEVVRNDDELWWNGFFEYINHIYKESAPSEVIDALDELLRQGVNYKFENRHQPISILMDAVIRFKAEELYKNETSNNI